MIPTPTRIFHHGTAFSVARLFEGASDSNGFCFYFRMRTLYTRKRRECTTLFALSGAAFSLRGWMTSAYRAIENTSLPLSGSHSATKYLLTGI